MSELHVLHVLNSAHGGSALSTFQLIRALREYGVKSSLICFDNATEKQKQQIGGLVENRVLFIPLYWSNKRNRVKWWKRPMLETLTIWRTWWGHRYQKRIKKLIEAHQIQLVHSSTLVNPEGAIAAKRNGLPHVWHARELIGPNTYYQFPRFQSWIKYVEKSASMLVANSLATSTNLSLYFSVAKITSIPNGIDPTSFKLKTHTQKKPLIVAILGNVTSRLKNHEFFIKTAQHLLKIPYIEFRIYGSLPDDNDFYYLSLQKLIRELNLVGSVNFMGNRDDVSIIMSEIDVLFHPTGHESFGRIFIEAMAGGIPIVAVDEGGAVELVRHGINGYRVAHNDVTAAAIEIEKLLNSAPLRNALGMSGRAIVEKEYSLSLLANRIFSLYKKVLKTDVV